VEVDETEVVFGWTVSWLMAGIETIRSISHNKPAEPAEAEANSNQISGPTYMYQDAIQSKKMAPTETPAIRHGPLTSFE
jgi:hypothetical protein